MIKYCGQMASPVPESLADQIQWDISRNVKVTDRPNLTFEDLPSNVQALLGTPEQGFESGPGPSPSFESGPMPRFKPDNSEICTDPEWREYWSRQGVMDAVCDTSTVLADILRKLRVSVTGGHAALQECRDVRDLVVALYNDRVLLIRTIRDYQTEQIRLRNKIERLTLYLKEVAREIQTSFPAEVLRKRGLTTTDTWTHAQWVSLFPQLHISVRRIITELAECNARLHGADGGPELDFSGLEAELNRVTLEMQRAQQTAEDADRRLAAARRVISALVKQAASMGYSLRAIDQSIDPDSDEAGVRAFAEGVKRYEFSAPDVPAAVGPFDPTASAAAVDNIRTRVGQLEAECRGAACKSHDERYPFPKLDEWG